jgi:hypothetical protein
MPGTRIELVQSEAPRDFKLFTALFPKHIKNRNLREQNNIPLRTYKTIFYIKEHLRNYFQPVFSP